MPHVLRLPDRIEVDPWIEADSEPAPDAPWLAPFALWQRAAAALLARQAPLGVRLAPADGVEALALHLPRIALVAIEYPTAGEGRGYTQARLLRERLRYGGELRAVGAVKRDQLFFLARCGFDSFALANGEDARAALASLERFSVAYQSSPAERADRAARPVRFGPLRSSTRSL